MYPVRRLRTRTIRALLFSDRQIAVAVDDQTITGLGVIDVSRRTHVEPRSIMDIVQQFKHAVSDRQLLSKVVP